MGCMKLGVTIRPATAISMEAENDDGEEALTSLVTTFCNVIRDLARIVVGYAMPHAVETVSWRRCHKPVRNCTRECSGGDVARSQESGLVFSVRGTGLRGGVDFIQVLDGVTGASVGGFFSVTGWPDLVAVSRGRVFVASTKHSEVCAYTEEGTRNTCLWWQPQSISDRSCW